MTNNDQYLCESNIGWSETFVVYKLLSNGMLRQMDQDFSLTQQDYGMIMSVIHDEAVSNLGGNGYVTFASKTVPTAIAQSKVIRLKDVAAQAGRLFSELVSRRVAGCTFPLGLLESELKDRGFVSHKNPIPDSQKSVKRDITLKVEDPKSGGTPTLGFSVKSEIGAPPTLLNASEATNIIYRIKGLTAEDAEEINAYNEGNKQIWKCTAIKERATSIEFEKYNCATFAENLDIVDAALPKIISDLVKVHYFETLTSPRPRVKGVFRPHDRLTRALEILNAQEPYRHHSRRNYCEIKVKRFLRACALGLMPSEVWNDVDDANGGYIIVLPDGELIGFYVYNRKSFEDYLLKETIFERGSTTRHKYMKLEPDGNSGDYLLKLNLDIRFSER